MNAASPRRRSISRKEKRSSSILARIETFPRNETKDYRILERGKLKERLARETLESRSSNFVTRYRCSLRARIYRSLLFPLTDDVIYAFPRRGEKNVAQRNGDKAPSRSLENVSRANEPTGDVLRTLEADRPANPLLLITYQRSCTELPTPSPSIAATSTNCSL